ncbi:hypothetical protein DE146DRAFT_408336 [Phaeosphaeria sp. MPI-PUGE-AT-0046c]|nr:hypothetical protein DE146DRAFT_408336 [Phaeosphaeria sp. MPI-PUGE-AT-0046c]
MNSIQLFKQFFSSFTEKAVGLPETTATPAQYSIPRTQIPGAYEEPPKSKGTVESQAHNNERSSDVNSALPDNFNHRRAVKQQKHQKDRRQKSISTTAYVRTHRAAEVVFEDFSDSNDPEPHGYMGTVGGVRFTQSTVEDYCPCGTGGGHYLSCGHTVVGNATCGSNCKVDATKEQPFNCPQCQQTVKDIFKNKFTNEQKEKVNSLHAKKDVLTIPVAVEYATKYLPSAKGNTAQTVMSLLAPGYGRECRDVTRKPQQPKTLAELYEEHHSTLEQNTRAHLAENKLGPLNKHIKRKATSRSANAPGTEDEVTPVTSKKQKEKLKSHQEPVAEANRGTKRAAPKENIELSDDETLVNNGTPSPVNKKLRQKLQVHREPLLCHPHGTKRKLSSSEQFANAAQPNKRVMSSFPQAFGEAKFMPIPAPGASSPWELERKRKRVESLYDGGNKRMRNWEVLPGVDVYIPEVFFGA